MSLAGLLDVVSGDPALRAALEAADAGTAALDLTAPAGMRPFVVAALAARTGRPVLAVTATGREAEDLVAALGSVMDPDRVALYPSWETLPHERLSPRADTVGRRIAVLRRLAHPSPATGPDADPATGPVEVVVAPVRSLLQPQVPGLGDLEPVALVAGAERDPEDVVRALVDLAYARVELVEKRGEFAVRGGIVDVFPPTEEHPVRVEFWGDTVEEVRWFKVADQRSMDGQVPAHGLWAPPCRELLLTPQVRQRAAALAQTAPQLRDICERIADGTPVEGMEALAPVLVDELVLLVDELPAGTTVLVLRPRAAAHPRRRPRPHQPGVPRGVVGDRGRRRRGPRRPRRGGVPHPARRPGARRLARAALVVGDPVHQRRRARGRHPRCSPAGRRRPTAGRPSAPSTTSGAGSATAGAWS